MRTPSAVLLACLAAALLAVTLTPSAGAASLSPAAGSSYPWVQPWAISGAIAPDVGSWTQPAARVPIVPTTGVATTGGLTQTYPWAQPWHVPAHPAIGP